MYCYQRERYHFGLIGRKAPKKKNELSKCDDKIFEKIQCVLWDQSRSAFAEQFKPLKDMQIDFDAHKSVDVSLIYNKKRPDSLKDRHREVAFQILQKVPEKKIILSHGGIPYDEYISLLQASKIVISPWGTGEWCWRDYEAVYTGAVLIKPDTSFVKSVPDLYQNGVYYVSCAHDFSDLREKISYVLNNYEKFTDMRKRARKLLVDYWDDEKIAKDFVDAIKSAVCT